MKIISKYCLLQFALFISMSFYSQVGINTTEPDDSSVLDVFSTSKGLLMPRLTTEERDNIVFPATGLMIYNSTLDDGQMNIGSSLLPSWVGFKGQGGPTINSISANNLITTTSASDELVSDMSISPQPGTYLVLFNAQHNTVSDPSFTTALGISDMAAICEEIKGLSGGVSHPLVFAGGETLNPGVYDVSGAASIGAGTLTLDGGGDPNSIFIIRATGAFSTATTTVVALTNGATANNVFWMSQVALSTAAGAVMKGSMISVGGAIGLGVNTNLEGRIFTKSGAQTTVGGCVITAPTGTSPIDLGILSTFAMWSSAGAVSDTATSTTTGDVGTGGGALTITGAHIGEKYPAGTTGTTPPVPVATYTIYQNGIKVVNSSRTIASESSVVSLQAMVTDISQGENIQIRWKVDTEEISLNNRTLLLISAGN